MSFSIQTNVNSLAAQENLRVNGDFQSRTINRLTSGYRINASGDDAAGLAVANKFRSDVAELAQGVRNANDGLSQLQIIDGGLNNISKMLDRMKTLATQAASSTFTGKRSTLNTEYKALLTEINRQASNVGLASASVGTTESRFAKNIAVYIGGSNGVESNAKVNVDLTGKSVDTTGLGINTTDISDVNVASKISNAEDLSGGGILDGASAYQDLTFNFQDGSSTTVRVEGAAGGIDSDSVTSQLNEMLGGRITASVATDDGSLQFSSDEAFWVEAAAAQGAAAGTGLTSAAGQVGNTALYNYQSEGFTAIGTDATHDETVVFTIDGTDRSVTFNFGGDGATRAAAVGELNTQLNQYGVYAFDDGTNIQLQSSKNFTIKSVTQTAGAAEGMFDATPVLTVTPPDENVTTDPTSNARTAISALDDAVDSLGALQGIIGTGQNKLQYAIQLAQSQISNFSAAESRIRDADVAAEAANLTKAQVLQQASLAAMAQANSAPQAVMALLRG